jgi:hypothetical protein
MRTSRMCYFVALAGLILIAGLATGSRPAAAFPPQAAPSLDFTKLPDFVGIHLGMPLDQARAAMEKAYPAGIDVIQRAYGPGGGSLKAVYMLRTKNTDGSRLGGTAEVDLTLPPNPQVVWQMFRSAPQPNVNRSVLIAALRQKYGRESLAIDNDTRRATTNDKGIVDMYWVMDEQGRQVSGTPPMLNNAPFGCAISAGNNGGIDRPIEGLPEYCAKSYVGVHVGFGTQEIITGTGMDMADIPLRMRNSSATYAFTQGQNQRIMQQQQEKSKEVKPQL